MSGAALTAWSVATLMRYAYSVRRSPARRPVMRDVSVVALQPADADTHSGLSLRVIVCGSRRWRDRDRIVARLFDLPSDTTIVHGNAAGADRIAHQEAQKLGLLVEPHPADWEQFGKAAGAIRNREMADLGADLCIAFWDGSSTGTAHMMRMAEERGIPVEIVR